MKCKFMTVIGILAILLGLLSGPVDAAPQFAQVVTPVPGPALNITQMTVNDGANGQTDPHLSGDWVSYTDNSVYGIHFQNLDMGVASDRIIPHSDGSFDSLSDINANIDNVYRIVFLRAVTGSEAIYLTQINPFGNPEPAVEVSPLAGSMRRRTALGGDTIAYEDLTYHPNTALAEIMVSSVSDPAAPAIRLTDDEFADGWPGVSPDGNAVVWPKCVTSNICDIWRVERTAGVWGAPEQVTGVDGNESLPETNGPVTVYGSDAGGDENIRWSVKDSSGAYVESVLPLPGIQRNPNIAGNLITFESNTTPGSQFDIYLYDLSTNRLYQLTNDSVSQGLSDISTGPSGLVRVVWAQSKQVYPYDMDVHAMSFQMDITQPVTTVTGVIDGATYDLGSVPQAGCTSTDIDSGVATEATLALSGADEQGAGNITATCSGAQDAAGNIANPVSVHYTVIIPDTTAPVISSQVSGTPGANGWYTSDVSLTWSVEDPESGVTGLTECRDQSITQDQAAIVYSCEARSAGGTASQTVSIARDAAKPVTSVTGVTEGAAYTLGSVPQTGCQTSDALSGVATEATLALTGADEQGVGSITATCSGAQDVAGNTADPAAVHYTVSKPSNTYNFTGFFQPVDNWPTENTMKAGASVPFKFSLGGDMGLDIFNAGSPTSQQVSCPSSSAVTVDAIEQTTTSNSGLSYDVVANQYIYVWKTNKLWVGTCRLFTIQFVDGSTQQALFKFSK